MLPGRGRSVSGRAGVTADSAFRQSAVWAALRLRADLISTLPIDVFRMVGAVQIEVPKPPVIVAPSGKRISMREWMYSTQIDLDRVGNCYGIISETDGAGLPKRIDLVAHTDVAVLVRDDVVSYRIKNVTYAEEDIWHERQFTLPGFVMGLSPVAHAAWSGGLYTSAQAFAERWFQNNGVTPSGILRNLTKVIDPREADKVKDRYKLAIEGGDLFVVGKDWEYSTAPAAAADARFLEQMNYSDIDAVRFFGVPGDLIEVQNQGSSITYANITQRNLQFLILNLGPAIVRREDALTRMVGAPRFVKLNSAALLRMDPAATSAMLGAEVAARLTAPSEARALMNRAPFTDSQLAEFAVLFPKGGTPAAPQTKDIQ